MFKPTISFVRAAALSLAAFAPAAVAQSYPTKSVRIIVPFSPGGSTDIVARALGAKASEGLGRSVIVENRAGAGGSIGAEAASKAEPDGYTLFMGHVGTLAINPALYPKLPYDSIRDFAPITLAITSPLLIVAHPSFPAKTVKELIALSRARPSDISFSSAGNGSASHLSGALLNSIAGLKNLHVPYKGTGPATIAVVSGEVSIMFSGQGTSWPLINSGKLRAIAQTGSKRIANAPSLPTVQETIPGYEVINWHGVLAPAGVSTDIIKYLNGVLVKALNSNEVKSKLSADGFEVMGGSPEAFAKFIGSEKIKWAKVIKDAGITLK